VSSLENLNKALAYIEENLAGDIDLRQVERLALCSEYHFRRMFSFLAGISLSEYIRRRRLTLAAFDLIHSDARVIDVAIQYGYNSADSFSRAFTALHGTTPSAAGAGDSVERRQRYRVTGVSQRNLDTGDKEPLTGAGQDRNRVSQQKPGFFV
jgi:AraC-like DNA-binding protein